MTSLFSPPLSLSQTAAVEAAVSANAVFKVPAAYDPALVTHPDPYSVLVHAMPSTLDDPGLQAVIVLHPRSDIPSHLGLPSLVQVPTPPPASSSSTSSAMPPPMSSSSSSSSSSTASPAAAAAATVRLEESVFLTVAPRSQPFLMYTQAPKALTMQISITEYLTLMSFVNKEWSRLCLKLEVRLDTMRENSEPVAVAGFLSFFSHGQCHYQVQISSRLCFKVRADSRTPKEKGAIKAWLELKSPSGSSSGLEGSGAGSTNRELVLPMSALTILAQDTSSYNALVDLVATYKSKSRKRSPTVAGCL
jgi:hypothetical protein